MLRRSIDKSSPSCTKLRDPARILFIMHDFSRGGLQSFTLNLIRSLPSHLLEPHVLYYSDVESLSMRQEFEEVVSSITYFSNFRISRRFSEFRQAIGAIRPDLVHVQGHEGMLTMLLWLRRLGLPVVNTFHSTHFDELGPVGQVKETLAQFCVDKIVHVSRETEARYSRAFRTAAGKHMTIYNGVDVPAIARRCGACARLPGWESGVHVLSVANFHPQKGYKSGVPILARLCDRFPQVTCHIVGGSHRHAEVERWVRSYLETRGLRDRIVLHGEQGDVVPFLASADIFFSPSDKELMPVTFLEALACGLPIVGTRTGGVPEILGDRGEWGAVCAIGDGNAMEAELTRLIVDPDLRLAMAQSARRRAGDFDISRVCKTYLALYESLLPT